MGPITSAVATSALISMFLSSGMNNWREINTNKNPIAVVNMVDTDQPILFQNDNSLTISSYDNIKLFKNLSTLEKLKYLKDNWNLYGAKPLDPHVIDSCINLISTLTYQPDIFPTANLSIQLEYENKNEDYLELEFFNTDHIISFFQSNTGEERYEVYNASQIKNLVDDFYA